MTDVDVSENYARSVLGEGGDGDVQLHIDEVYQVSDSPWKVPAYRFTVLEKGQKAGTISFRVSEDDRLVRCAGPLPTGIKYSCMIPMATASKSTSQTCFRNCDWFGDE